MDITQELWAFTAAQQLINTTNNIESLVNNIPEDVANTILETGITIREAIRLLLSVAVGKTTITDLGAGNAEVKFKDTNDTKDRITANMLNSERINITLDKT
jgi:hypothetical protein